jgi:iron complex transport system substrate-binding protein
VCAVSYKTVEQAARMFETEVRVVSLEPNTIEDIFANIRTVGELTGREAQASEVVGSLRARLERVGSRLADTESRPRTLMLEWLEPVFAPGHWVPEQVHAAGGDGGFGRAGQPSVRATAEEINAYAPEVIVMIPCGYYKEDILRQLPRSRLPLGWSDLPGVRTNQVWAVDATSYFSRPGPRVIDGIEILARILHPEVFGEPSAQEAVRVHPDLMKA